MFSKLSRLVQRLRRARRAASQLQTTGDLNKNGKTREAARDEWLEQLSQLSEFKWIDENERAMPPGEKKGWLEGMFGSTRPAHVDELGANMSDWVMGPAEESKKAAKPIPQ